MNNIFAQKIYDDQERALENAKLECIKRFGNNVLQEVLKPSLNKTIQEIGCPPYFDSILCWPETPPGNLSVQNCPSYIAGSLPFHATRQCMENGVWFNSKTENASWTNYTSCFKNELTTIFVEFNKTNISHYLQLYYPIAKRISEIGYIVSLVTLVIAFVIMLFIRKLHCARNILHMHLFASFMLRALFFIILEKSFIDGMGLPQDFNYQNGAMYFDTNLETNNWICKLIVSFWQYFLMANYSWILMEGLYLHNLIFRALFADGNNSIKWYIIMGWGMPLLVICGWVSGRLFMEDALCWTINQDYRVLLILAIPTMASILINLVLFMRISMVLYVKLRSPINEDSRRYQKWVKSTLVLVPLFGVHYSIFIALYYMIKINPIVELIWLISDRLFSSFQGFVVAILYCFLNGEVKAELLPHMYICLTFLATNKYSKYFVPYRKKILRSVVGRTSICTTMSCSSLYNNGVVHRSSRLDSLPKTRCKDHICQNGSKCLHDSSRRSSKSHLRQNDHQMVNFSGTAETSLGNERCPEVESVHEETSRMMIQNNF